MTRESDAKGEVGLSTVPDLVTSANNEAARGLRYAPLVAPRDEEIVVVKHFPNSFRGTDLLKHLQNNEIDELIICGAMSQMCIDATVRAAFDLGFTCTVAEDACATKDLNFKGTTIPAAAVHAAFMAALTVPYARILSTQEIIATMV